MPADRPSPSERSLLPTLGLFGLLLFGIGNMLGAGIYGLIGKAAGVVGNAVWLSFLASVVAAGCTGLTYASLGSRFPRAAGAAYIARRVLGHPLPAYILGLTLTLSGIVSMAAGSHVFAMYFSRFVPDATAWIVIAVYVAALGVINVVGMRQSSWFNIVCTIVEASGLLLVIAVGMRYWGSVNYLETVPTGEASSALNLTLVLSAAALTFYAFIGFEDVLNVAEEVKNPRKTIPAALIIALSIIMIIYMAVAISAVSVVPAKELAESDAPLALVVDRAAPSIWPMLLPLIALFAIANTGLLNYIMSSRMVFGLSRDGLLPRFLSNVNRRRRTPHVAIVFVGIAVLAIGLPFPLTTLATVSSILLLSTFIVMNVCMILVKRQAHEPKGAFEVPYAVPALGIIVNIAMIAHAEGEALVFAAVALACITAASIVILLLVKPKEHDVPASKA